MSKLLFKIYVAGLNTRNKELIASFQRACATTLTSGNYQIEVVDIIKHPGEAEAKKNTGYPNHQQGKTGTAKTNHRRFY
jgi:hypothetical protein